MWIKNKYFKHHHSFNFFAFLYFYIASLVSGGLIGVCFLYYIEKSPYPDVNPRIYIAYPNIYFKGTSALKQYISPFVYVFVI